MNLQVIKMSPHCLFQASSGVEEKFFKTMKDLIRHYKKRNQGLATHLNRSLKRKTLPEQSFHSQSPEPPVHNEENEYESECQLFNIRD